MNLTLAERILAEIRFGPLDDDVLAKRLGVSQRQSVNQAARRLEARGVLRRSVGPDGKIVNALVGTDAPLAQPASAPPQSFGRTG
jgi:DNA-binding FadR family transcriptional regulator